MLHKNFEGEEKGEGGPRDKASQDCDARGGITMTRGPPRKGNE